MTCLYEKVLCQLRIVRRIKTALIFIKIGFYYNIINIVLEFFKLNFTIIGLVPNISDFYAGLH